MIAGKMEMAEADLDGVIRSVAKKQIKTLTVAARKRHGRLMAMAGKAKDKGARDRYRHLAKSTLLHAAAAARRLHITAENTADSYVRSMKKAIEEATAAKSVNEKPVKETGKESIKKITKKAANKKKG
jgi:hypothetical protein